MTKTTSEAELKVADEVWIATALLHREHPESPDFTVDEIVERAKKEGLQSLFGAESTFTPSNIALRIVPQILDAIGCCWKRGLAIADYSTWEIPTIPSERGRRLLQNARISHTGTAAS